MSLNVVAATSSALAAGLLRFQLAGQRVMGAAAASVDPSLAQDPPGDDDASPLAVYDARGRTAAPPASDDLVAAVIGGLSPELVVDLLQFMRAGSSRLTQKHATPLNPARAGTTSVEE